MELINSYFKLEILFLVIYFGELLFSKLFLVRAGEWDVFFFKYLVLRGFVKYEQNSFRNIYLVVIVVFSDEYTKREFSIQLYVFHF